MARARNIKPGLFKNEVLGVADPMLTLLFEGLWLLADREGRLEDRPLRIKAEVFPYREGLDVAAMITWLESNGFIHRYQVDGKSLIQIENFVKHQNPHKNEPASILPSPDQAGATSGKIGSALADSGFRIPDSGFLIPECRPAEQAVATAAQPPAPPPPVSGKPKREQTTLAVYLEACKAAGIKPVPDDHHVKAWATDAGISTEMLQIAWVQFRERYLTDEKAKGKRYKDWPGHFANAVKANWFKLWFMGDDNRPAWSSIGLTHKAALDAKKARETAHA